MISVGLQPIAADNANKMTGQKMTHVIIKDGHFDKLINESSFQIRYYSAMTDRDQTVNKKKNKVKYTCSQCGSHVWGKPQLHITCSDCKNPFAEDEERES